MTWSLLCLNQHFSPNKGNGRRQQTRRQAAARAEAGLEYLWKIAASARTNILSPPSPLKPQRPQSSSKYGLLQRSASKSCFDQESKCISPLSLDLIRLYHLDHILKNMFDCVLKKDLKHERSFEIDDDITMLSLFGIDSRWIQILGHIKTQNHTIDKKRIGRFPTEWHA